MKKIAVVGGGIIGLAIAFKLSQEKFKVTLFEKENTLGKHQSGKNSGVLHCGLHYKPGSLKANLAVSGIRKMKSFCEKKIASVPAPGIVRLEPAARPIDRQGLDVHR